MRYQAIAVALMLALSAAGSTVASEIYKWTDEEGNVHFGDRPDGADSEHVAIRSKPTDPARVEAMAHARADAAAAAAKAAEEQAAATPAGPTPEELQVIAEERARKCATYREKLQRFVRSRRIYREDENGERVYLDEEEMRTAREKAENQVQEYCSS